MFSLTAWLEAVLGIPVAIQYRIFASLLIFLILWTTRWLVLRVMDSRLEDNRARYQWHKASNYVVGVLAVFLVGRLWIAGIQSLATFLGLLSAGLAIALQDLLKNLAGWIFILWRRPLVVGDRVEIGGIAGDVVDLRLFEFTLMEIGNWVNADQSTGRVIHIPNSWVFTRPLANYTRGFEFVWNEIGVLITFESNWEKAKALFTEIARRHSPQMTKAMEQRIRRAARKYMIVAPPLTPIVYTSVQDSGVLFSIRYLCDPRRRRSTAEAIWEDVLRMCAEHPDIELAYPTIRYYHRGEEASSPIPANDALSGAEQPR